MIEDFVVLPPTDSEQSINHTNRVRLACRRGHLFTESNTLIEKQSMGRPGFRRTCRKCHSLRQQGKVKTRAKKPSKQN